jgi:hypothetical protein
MTYVIIGCCVVAYFALLATALWFVAPIYNRMNDEQFKRALIVILDGNDEINRRLGL